MGSTLTVQNIQGPTSGANANKIIIPSGHTLDASAGGVTLPAGVGGKLLKITTAISTEQVTPGTTGSFIDIGSDIIVTPTTTGSDFIYFVYISQEADQKDAYNTFYRFEYKINSGSWTAHDGSKVFNGQAAQGTDGTFNDSLNYLFSNISYSAGDQLGFRVTYNTSRTGMVVNQQALTGQPSGTSNAMHITVMEIAG